MSRFIGLYGDDKVWGASGASWVSNPGAIAKVISIGLAGVVCIQWENTRFQRGFGGTIYLPALPHDHWGGYNHALHVQGGVIACHGGVQETHWPKHNSASIGEDGVTDNDKGLISMTQTC